MDMFAKLRENLKTKRRTIVFTEGPDPRILEATFRLKNENLMDVILVGNESEVRTAAANHGFDISGVTILDPATYPEMDAMVSTMVELRKGKMSADTVRPALQLVKTKPGAHLVSSCFILNRPVGEENLRTICMGDCAINIDYQDDKDKNGNVTFTAAQKLAEVAVECAKTAAFFGIDPKVAFLSFSTKGSGKGGTVKLSNEATQIAKQLNPGMAIDGEMQFDAAVSPTVGQLKFPGSPVAGYANTFIFPLIEAGNIGYKIAQRLGCYDAYGPILQGLNAPINDLSRGCNADEVFKMAIITAGMA